MTGSLVNWALFRKELRAALPLALFWWFIWGLPLIENSLAVAPDMVSFRGALDAFDASGTTVLLGGVIGLWLACSLLPAEQASGTVEFLDSLPTSRDRVFWTKAVTGAAIL